MASLAAGLAVAVAPYLLFWALDWGPIGSGSGGARFIFAALPLFGGGFVFALCARDEPLWLDGAWLGLALSIAGIIALVATDATGPGFTGVSVFGGIVIVILGTLVGATGAEFGALVTRPLTRERPHGPNSRVQAWHVGAGVAVAEVVAILAAIFAQS